MTGLLTNARISLGRLGMEPGASSQNQKKASQWETYNRHQSIPNWAEICPTLKSRSENDTDTSASVHSTFMAANISTTLSFLSKGEKADPGSMRIHRFS